MRGWNECPRCAGTGNGEGGRGCGYQPPAVDHRVELAEVALARWKAERGTAVAGAGGLGGFIVDHGSLREPWKIPSDIPEQPRTGTVLFVSPYHTEEFDEATKAHARELLASCRAIDPDFGKATDLLHPTGRCTCGGEGECEWCKGLCPACLGDCYETQCPVCDSTGWRPDEPELPDYGALGYPETEVRNTPHRFETLAAQVLSWWR